MMNPDDLASRLDLATTLVREAGARAMRHFRSTDLVTASKGLQDPVTVADREVEAHLVDAIAQRFPGDAVIGEEGGAHGTVGSDTPVWVIDPIDGTDNFARGLPLWCVSVGVVVGSRAELGLILAPALDEFYVARRGHGCTRNGAPVQVSSCSEAGRARINLGYSRRRPAAGHLQCIERLLANDFEYSRLGSGALGLAYVADGRFDGYWESHVNSWDVAAGLCIATEAGAWVSDFLTGDALHAGNPILACTPALAAPLRRLLGPLSTPAL